MGHVSIATVTPACFGRFPGFSGLAWQLLLPVRQIAVTGKVGNQ
jgi:hypothetical protein